MVSSPADRYNATNRKAYTPCIAAAAGMGATSGLRWSLNTASTPYVDIRWYSAGATAAERLAEAVPSKYAWMTPAMGAR